MSSSEAAGRGAQPDKSPGRRRRTYSDEEKQRPVAESFEPGASVSGIAQRHGMNANLLFTWRRQMRPTPTAEPTMELIPVEIVGAAEGSSAMAATPSERRGAIEIALAGGARVQVDANVNEAALKRVLSALKATT
jgi:transposase